MRVGCAPAPRTRARGLRRVWSVESLTSRSRGFQAVLESTANAGPAPAAPPAGGTTHQVAITSTGFAPSTLSISAGDSVNWTNQDYSAHTATADDHSWATPTLTSGKSFARPFPSAGTFAYHCHIHHEMTATVVVA